MMNKKVVKYKDIGEVTFKKYKQSKSVKIKIDPYAHVSVSLPYRYSFLQAQNFVLKNKTWIIQKREEVKKRQPKITEQTILLTKLHTLYVREGKKFKVDKIDMNVNIYIINIMSDDSQQYINHVITEIYRIEAKTILPKRLNQLALKHGFSFNKVSIRNNKSNWGSCSSQNNISLNLQMMKLPDELIDYILLHELVHTEIKNHSSKFWNRLDEVTNFKARSLNNAVKKYATYTLT